MQLTKEASKEFNKRLFSMVLPIAFQSLMNAAVSAADSVMLGFVEQAALSAVALANQVAFVLNICITVLVQGTTMLAAQYWGKGEKKTVERILALAMRYMLMITLLFLAAAVFVPQLLMKCFTHDPELVSRGVEYLRVVGFSYMPLGVAQVYLCIMKNSGKTAKSTVIGSSAMVLNVLFNYILIFGNFGFPAMGIRGAAVATVIASMTQCVWALAESFKKDSVHIRVKYMLHPDKVIRRDFLHYSWPIVGNYFFWGGGVTLYSVIIGHLGNDAVAANSFASIVRNLLSCAVQGVGTAGAILVGNELGRNAIEEAKLYAKRVAVLAVSLGTISGVLLLAARPFIVSIVNLTPQAKEYFSGMLLICSYYIIAYSLNSPVIGGIFCAGGKSKFGCICDGVVLWGIIIPLAATAAFILHLPVIWVYFILCLDEIVKVPVVIWYFRRYSWAQNLTRESA